MIKKQHILKMPLLLLLIGISYSSCVKEVGRVVPSDANICDSLDIKYSTDIQALVQNNCALSGCHNGAAGAPYPNDLTDFATLKTVADNGRITVRVINEKTMPTTGPLPDSLIQKLRCWIEGGALNN